MLSILYSHLKKICLKILSIRSILINKKSIKDLNCFDWRSFSLISNQLRIYAKKKYLKRITICLFWFFREQIINFLKKSSHNHLWLIKKTSISRLYSDETQNVISQPKFMLRLGLPKLFSQLLLVWTWDLKYKLIMT